MEAPGGAQVSREDKPFLLLRGNGIVHPETSLLLLLDAGTKLANYSGICRHRGAIKHASIMGGAVRVRQRLTTA